MSHQTKVLAPKSDTLGSDPETHMGKEENQRLKVDP